MGFSLRVNSKQLASGVANPPDTKKKELVGNFKNNGKLWQQIPIEVYDHDFPTHAVGKAVPYGIYDTQNNSGTVFVGYSADTPSFAVECIEKWWKKYGKRHYPDKTKLLIIADSGGSTGYRSRVWKYQIQKQLCDEQWVISKYLPLSAWDIKMEPNRAPPFQ